MDCCARRTASPESDYNMIDFKTTTRLGAHVIRQHRIIHLETALSTLLRMYDRCGGPLPEVSGLIEGEIERSLNERKVGRERVQSHLQHLLRARDIHRYAMSPPELTPLKVAILEHLLFHRDPAGRWASIREFLAGRMEMLCESPWSGITANLENYKQALTDRRGHLGRLLTLVAMFNLELEGEAAPDNAVIHFIKGQFPLYHWELGGLNGHGGQQVHGDSPLGWQPENPLCRWEYLANDLFHFLLRKQGQENAVRERRENTEPSSTEIRQPFQPFQPSLQSSPTTMLPDFPAPSLPEGAAGDLQIFSRLEGWKHQGDQQMELLPFDPVAFFPELLSLVHRRLGVEAVKPLVLLIHHACSRPAGGTLVVETARLAADATLNDLSSRGMAASLRRLERVLELLSGVELTRIPLGTQQESGRTSRLLRILPLPPLPGEPAGEAADVVDSDTRLVQEVSGKAASEIQVEIDPVMFQIGREALGKQGLELPEILMISGGKYHPYVIPLYLFLRRCWSEASRPEPLERSIDQLTAAAGLWVSPTGRYRALEAIKADLNLLTERGYLAKWRIKRGSRDEGTEDRFVMIPPDSTGGVPGKRTFEPIKESPSGGWADTG